MEWLDHLASHRPPGNPGRALDAGDARARTVAGVHRTGDQGATGCTNIYTANWAEVTWHVHFHLIPRAADLAPDLRGARVFTATDRAADERSMTAVQQRVLAQITDDLPRRRSVPSAAGDERR